MKLSNAARRRLERSLSVAPVLCGAAAMGAFALSNAHAAATPVTFAKFIQATPSANANQFEYVDQGEAGAGGDAELTTVSGGVLNVGIPVTFTYLSFSSTLAADLQGPQQATLTLTSSTTAPAQIANVFGVTLGHQQVFGNGLTTDTLTITRDSAAGEGSGTRKVLLKMTFTGDLIGELGDPTPELTGNTNDGNTVSYVSDFLTIGSPSTDDFNMAFTSWTTIAGGGGLSMSAIANDPYFASATAAGAATFDSSLTPVVVSMPEARVGPMLAALGIVFLGTRRRRVAKI